MTTLRASLLPSFCDCPRRAAATLLHDEIVEAGYKLREYRRASIAPVIGHCVDAGANCLLRAKQAGCEIVTERALAWAIAAFRLAIADGCDYDAVTPNPTDAEKQIARMLEVFRLQVLPDIKPDTIQHELHAAIGADWELSGHWDNRDTQKLGHDLKTGVEKWPCTPQQGGYVLLGEANEMPWDAAVVDYIPRTAIKKPQEPASKTYYEAELLRRHAVAVIKRVKRDVEAFRSSGDVEAIAANPFSQFCSGKHCPAYNVKGDKTWCDWWRR